jgi:cellulose synthase/poly-beta-1,6-N-acetylglucosamine synthase-like glycosyltransferase
VRLGYSSREPHPLSVDSSQPVALSIVVPTYNERDRLPDLVAAVFDAYASANLSAELIIVDDNSPDGTAFR